MFNKWIIPLVMSLGLHAALLCLFIGMSGGETKIVENNTEANNPATGKAGIETAVKDDSGDKGKLKSEEDSSAAPETEKEMKEKNTAVKNSIKSPKAIAEITSNVSAKVSSTSTDSTKKKKEQVGKDSENFEWYQVKAGDSWIKIARTHGCMLKDLAKLNGLELRKLAGLKKGARIKVPVKKPAAEKR